MARTGRPRLPPERRRKVKMVRLLPDAAAFIERSAAKNNSSHDAEIARAIYERMAREGVTRQASH